MSIENSEWIGLDWNDPCRIRSWQELIRWIDEVGFLPLFKNKIDGFQPRNTPLISTGGAETRSRILGSGGSSLPAAVRWPTASSLAGKPGSFPESGSPALPTGGGMATTLTAAGTRNWPVCVKSGEKNFEGMVTNLQMGGYLLIRDFRQRLNKKGQPYGWPLSVYATPESLWGYEHISSAYSVEPEQSRDLIYQQICRNFPTATGAALHTVLG